MGPLSVRDLARVLGRKPTAIYRHLISLEKLGLVRSSATSGARGRPAMTYRTAAPLVRLPGRPASRATARRWSRSPARWARQAAREYASAFHAEGWTVDGPKRNHGFFELITSPSPKKLAKINALLDELAQLMWTPDENPGRPLRVTWFMSPSTKTRAKTSKSRRSDDAKAAAKPDRSRVVKFTGSRARNTAAGRGRALRRVSAA